MRLDLLSRYRTQLMGLAILWIMLFHSNIDFSWFTPLGLLKEIGNVGVDIFMLVSGFGIYYSLSKKPSLKTYYKNRLRRILPYYLPIVLIYSLYMYSKHIWGVDIVIKNMLMISYWDASDLSKMFDWYIPSILVVYLLTPLFYHFFKKNKVVASLSVILFFYTLSFFVMGGPYAYLQLIILRVPIYIIGFWIADYLKNNKEAKLGALGITLCVIGWHAGFGSLYYVATYLPHIVYDRYVMYGFAMLIFPLCIFTCYLFSLLPRYKYPFLTFCGGNTLYMYIFHERVLNVLVLNNVAPYTDIIAFALTFLLSIVWSKFVDYTLSKL